MPTYASSGVGPEFNAWLITRMLVEPVAPNIKATPYKKNAVANEPSRKYFRDDSLLIAARRRNARKSTGPRTAAGKRRAALNALKDGVYAGQQTFAEMLLALGEDPGESQGFVAELPAALDPADATRGRQARLRRQRTRRRAESAGLSSRHHDTERSERQPRLLTRVLLSSGTRTDAD